MLSLVASSALSANTAEITTTNVRSSAAFDNLKATWGKALTIGDLKTDLECEYDYNANKNFLSSATLTGDLSEGDDMSVSYEITHDFNGDKTDVELTAVSGDVTFTAKYDTEDQLTEFGAQKELDVGDSNVDVDATWLVKSKTARVKLMTAAGDDNLSVQIDYADGGATSYELGYEHNLEDGRDLTATFNPDSKNLELELVDTTFESGATWTATANLPMEDGANIVDGASVTLKRSWEW